MLRSRSRKTAQFTGLFDVHCHLVPGVDDGSSSVEMSLEILRREYEDGVRTVIVTPHYRLHMFENEEEDVVSAFEELKQRAESSFDGMRLYLGCELHENGNMLEMVQRRDQFTMAGTQFVLVEFSGRSEASLIRRRLYELVANGYTPIIAHAERYKGITDDLDFLQDLVGLGIRVQVNADSVIGKVGGFYKRFCGMMLDAGLVHYVGSDAHDPKERPPRIGECAAYIQKKYGTEMVKRLFYDNPKEILITGEKHGDHQSAAKQ